MLFNRQSTEDQLRQMPRWHAQYLANILPVRSTEFARSLIYNIMLAALVWVKEFMSKLWVSAWLKFQVRLFLLVGECFVFSHFASTQCDDLPAPNDLAQEDWMREV
jgi:hypothetical protein